MRVRRSLICGMLGMVMWWWPAWAEAQAPPVELPIGIGQKVRITRGDGKVTTGTIQALTPGTVEVGKGAARASVAIADVRRIQIPDSVTNGVAIGALTLGLVGGLWGAVGDVGTDLVVELTGTKSDDSSHVLMFAAGGAAVGALLGWAIDAGKMQTIYKRENSGVSVGVHPIASPAGKGIGLSLRW